VKPVYCDESVWLPVARGLCQRGWTVYTAQEQDMLGEPDREQLAQAVTNNWILLTVDDDCLSLVETDDYDHAGIIYVNQAGKQIGDVVKAVDAQLQQTPETNQIHYL